MRMDFEVAGAINLKELKQGQNVEFSLKKQGDWDYLITEIKPISTH